MLAAHGEGAAAKRDHGAVGKRIDCAPVHALGLAGEPLGVQTFVHCGGAGARLAAREQRGESVRLRVLAFEAGPVTGGERRHLVEENNSL